jgi:membrane protease YdiL (CAAX protease family)
MPLITAWAAGARPSVAEAGLVPGLLIGVAVGIAMVAIEALVFLPYLPPSMESLFTIPLWKRLLGGIVYGGITEELFMRLFLMSSLASIASRWWKAPNGRPAAGAFWIAILVVAVLFGLGHLPATSAVTPLTTAIVVRALVLNGVAGIAFGYLFWKRGLEAAMAGHMGAHLVLQIPGAMLLARLT